MKNLHMFKECDTCKIDKSVKNYRNGSETCNKCSKKANDIKMATGLYYNPEETKQIWYYKQ